MRDVIRSVWAIQVGVVLLPKVKRIFIVEIEHKQDLEKPAVSLTEDRNHICKGTETGKSLYVWANKSVRSHPHGPEAISARGEAKEGGLCWN